MRWNVIKFITDSSDTILAVLRLYGLRHNYYTPKIYLLWLSILTDHQRTPNLLYEPKMET